MHFSWADGVYPIAIVLREAARNVIRSWSFFACISFVVPESGRVPDPAVMACSDDMQYGASSSVPDLELGSFFGPTGACVPHTWLAAAWCCCVHADFCDSALSSDQPTPLSSPLLPPSDDESDSSDPAIVMYPRGPRPPFAGLRNQGATCYLNSLVQTLSARHALHFMRPVSALMLMLREHCLLATLRHLSQLLRFGSSKSSHFPPQGRRMTERTR